MPEESFEEKTEKPTPRKREEVRKKGDVAKSKELPSVAVLLSSLITLTFCGSYLYTHLQTMMQGAWSLFTLRDLSVPVLMEFAEGTIVSFILLMAPLLAAVFMTAIVSNVIQVGFMLSGEKIKPDPSNINPIKGLGRLFSKNAFMDLFKSLLKLAIIGTIAYLSIKGEVGKISLLAEMEIRSIIVYILMTSFKISIKCALAMIFLVIIDYAFQKWEFEKRIKMTKKEFKDDHKKTEGDPQVKGRIKSIQMQMARKRMMQAVPKADVIITNPTHLAVALEYDISEMNAPKVVAKGAGEIARRIKELAIKHDIPIVENKALAQSLNALADIGQEIPGALYQAVAGILAYVYKLKGPYAHGSG